VSKYGIPYMGSKAKICDQIIKIFPKADHFYDLFGGGFSVTHAMLLKRSKDFKHFHFNEIRPGICDLIQKAIAGEFNYKKFKPPFVSREEFSKNLDTDPMIKILWSFGNNGKNYLFGDDIEGYKRSMHNAIVFNEFDSLAEAVLGMKSFAEGYSIKQRRLFLRNRILALRNSGSLNALGLGKFHDRKLQELQQLERLEQLQQLEQLERLQFTSTSYDEVEIHDNSVIFCDPPYAGTAKYDSDFDHKNLFDWAHSKSNPVFISEYQIKDERFVPVWKMPKRSMLSSNKDKCVYKVEKVYVNKAGMEIIRNRRLANAPHPPRP